MDTEALVDWILTLDDATVADVLRQARYGARHPRACRACGSPRFRRSSEHVRVDVCRSCGTEHSVTARTPFHRTRLPLAHVLAAAILVTRDGSVSSNALSRRLRISWQTARFLGHRIREALAREPRHIQSDHAEVQWMETQVRRDHGEYPVTRRWGRMFPPRLTLVVLVDGRTGACAITISQNRRAYALKTLIERELPGVPEVDYERRTLPTVVDLDKVLGRTHQRVSRRWLEVYLGAISWCRGRAPDEGRAWEALRVVFAARPKTWSQLRPAKMPDFDSPSRFFYPKPPPDEDPARELLPEL